MSTLIQVPVLGRPSLASAVFEDQIQCYAMKFVLSDIYVFLASMMCELRTSHRLWRPSSLCTCCSCARLWLLRTPFMFWGPSPLGLLCALRNRCASSVEDKRAAPELWQVLREALQVRFGIAVDLYCVQMLPCIWRRIVRRNPAAPWTSPYRQAVESIWTRESARLEEAKAWLQHFGLGPIHDVGSAAEN